MEILVNIALTLFWVLVFVAALGVIAGLILSRPTGVEKELEEESRRLRDQARALPDTLLARFDLGRQPSPPASASPALPAPGSGDQEPRGSTDAGEHPLAMAARDLGTMFGDHPEFQSVGIGSQGQGLIVYWRNAVGSKISTLNGRSIAHELIGDVTPQGVGENICPTCHGKGTVDETLGGHAFSGPEALCPDCKP